MSNTISPLLSAKLNNTTINKTVNSNSQASTAIQSNGDNSDTFIKRNKKKIIIGSAIGATVVAVGFVLLAKSGKLGNKCQEFVNGIFHFTQKSTPQAPTSKTPDVQMPDKLIQTDASTEILAESQAKPVQKLSDVEIQQEAKLRTEQELLQKRNAEIAQAVEEAKIERGLSHKSVEESAKVFEQAGKSEVEIDKINDFKKREIESLRTTIEEEKAKFIEEHITTSYEERREQVAKYCRTSYGGNYANTVHGEQKAVKRDSEYIDYLEQIWQDTPRAKELTLQLNLQEMSAEKLDLFNKALSILDGQKVEYDKSSLSSETVDTLRQIVEGKCSQYDQVLHHGDAYMVNGALRAGFEVNDTERLILDSGFKTVEPLSSQTTVYRNVIGSKEDGSIEFINNLVNAQKGYVFSDKGYGYASFNPHCAQVCNGATQAANSPEIRLNIVVPKGARVSNGMGYEQQEMLFPRNAQFRVLKEATDPRPEDKRIGNYLEMLVEYILPKE